MEGIIETNGGHMFASSGGDVLKCEGCGLEIPREDIRLFGIKRTKEDVEEQGRKAETLVEVLTVLGKNNFREWKPEEVKDMKKLASGETSLLSTERVETTHNTLRYGRVCGLNKLRR